jgi:hypothetical protein
MSNATVLVLQPKERPQQDINHIAAIYRNLDRDTADQVVARALDELGQMLVTMAERIAGQNMQDALRRIKRFDMMAENLGLVSLSLVAQDLAICLRAGDATAFSAVWARLLRLADCTLTCDFTVQDMGGA